MAGSSTLDWLWRIELLLYCAFLALTFISSNPAQSLILGIPVSRLILGLGPVVFILPIFLAYFDYKVIKQKVGFILYQSQATFFIVEYLATGILILLAAPLIVRGVDPFGIFIMLSFITLFPYLLFRSIVPFENIAGREISLAIRYPYYSRGNIAAGLADKAADVAEELITPPILGPAGDIIKAEASPEPQKVLEKFTLKKALYLIIPSLACAGFVIEAGFYSPLMFDLGYKVLYALVVWVTVSIAYATMSGIVSVVPSSFMEGVGKTARGRRELIFAAPLLIFVAGVMLGAIYFSGITNSDYHNYQVAQHPELKYCERYDPTAPANNPPCYAKYAKEFNDSGICYLAQGSKSDCVRLLTGS